MSLVIDAVRNRRSSRYVSSRPLSQEQIDALIEAFRWGPSSNNKQPWRLLIARSPEAQAAWDACLAPGNQSWAPRAPFKVMVIGNPTEQQENFGQQRYLLDCGLALQNMLIQGCGMGLNIRVMVGYDEAKAKASFDIADPLRVVAFVAAGHPADPGEFADDVREKEARPRARKPASEVAFYDRLG